MELANFDISLDGINAELSRRKFEEYVKYTHGNYSSQWYHSYWCRVLDAFVNGDIKRLILTGPPRHGKSEIVSRRLPSYILGKHPDDRLISCSYGSDLASGMNRDVQRIMDSSKYNAVFPNVRLGRRGEDKLRNSSLFEIGGNYSGAYTCSGVGGPIMGIGANWAIIDDVFKNHEEASSPTMREKIFEWYSTTFYTRLERDASVLITMTRWHEDDLVGRLLELMQDDPYSDQWVVINIPAIREDMLDPNDPRKMGEALWPWKYPLERLLAIKSVLGSYWFSALFQQNPAPEEGGVVKSTKWFKYWTVLPGKFDKKITSWDLPKEEGKDNTYMVGEAWGKLGPYKYLIDQVRDKLGFTDQIHAMRAFMVKHADADEHLIENGGNGAAAISVLKDEFSAIIKINPTEGKKARAQAISVSPQIEAGNVLIPDPSIATWVNDYIQEWKFFPNGKYDDQVDCSSQALTRLGDVNSILDVINAMDKSQIPAIVDGEVKMLRSERLFNDIFWPGDKGKSKQSGDLGAITPMEISEDD